MAWHQGLAGAALLIASTPDRPLRVMAGPGTGKTFALKRLVARLLQDGAEPERILIVTFTRTAAADLKREVQTLDVEGCGAVRAGTLHSYCFSLLNRNQVFEYLDRTARPLVTFLTYGVARFEAEPLLYDLNNAEMFGGVRDRTKRIRAFEAAWARLQSDDAGWPHDHLDRQFQDALLAWLRFHQSMLIGELVPETLRYLRNNPACAELQAFDHVVVDEYQDLNRAEQVLIDHLARHVNQTIVGDQDQSIYGFLRHAHSEGIGSFHETHVGTHDEALLECRRCPQRVVRIADYLIRHNHPGKRNPILQASPLNSEGEVRIVQWPTLEEEAVGLAHFIQHLIQDRGIPEREILVLSPRRLIGYAIRDAVSELGIPVHSFYHEEALEDARAQVSFCLLTLLVNSEDRSALRFWLGVGSPSWRQGAYRRVRQHCENLGISPREALERLTAGTLNIPNMTALIQRFQALRAELERLRPMATNELIDALFPNGEDGVKVLREAALLSAEAHPDVSQLLDSLRDIATQPEMPESGEFVRIMSLHKSKGLSATVVIVAGCVQGLIPAVDKELTPVEATRLLLEQRRLFYVAVTRTREWLVLSAALRIDPSLAHRIGAVIRRGGVAMTSQFIDELGPVAPASQPGREWMDRGFD
jgi:DNA helicase-2/ATP-dependent DNA helicase PcrA